MSPHLLQFLASGDIAVLFAQRPVHCPSFGWVVNPPPPTFCCAVCRDCCPLLILWMGGDPGLQRLLRLLFAATPVHRPSFEWVLTLAPPTPSSVGSQCGANA